MVRLSPGVKMLWWVYGPLVALGFFAVVLLPAQNGGNSWIRTNLLDGFKVALIHLSYVPAGREGFEPPMCSRTTLLESVGLAN